MVDEHMNPSAFDGMRGKNEVAPPAPASSPSHLDAGDLAKWLRAIVEHSDDAIISKTLEGIVTSWNPAAEKMFGYKTGEIIGRSILAIIPPDRRNEEEMILARLRDGNRVEHFETVRMRKDGTKVDVSVTISPVKDDAGKVIGASKIVRDITSRKEAEEAQRMSDARYRSLFEYAPDGILICDPATRYIDANSSICKMLGYKREELIGLYATDIVGMEEAGNIEPALDVIKSKTDYHREWQFRRKDGSVFPADVIAAEMPDGNIMGMVRDITERKQAAESLREIDERLKTVTDTAQVGLVMVDGEHRYRYANRAYTTMLNIPTEDIVGRKVADVLPPVYATQIRPRLDRAFKGERVEYELTVPSAVEGGKPRHYAVTYLPGMDRSKRVVIVMIVDVTETRRAAEALRESEERLQTVTENLSEGLIISDINGKLIHWNRAGLAIHGFSSLEEGMRMLPEFADTFELATLDGKILSLDQWPLALVLAGGRVRDMEVRIRRHGMDWERIFNYSGEIVHDASGKAVAFLAINDITLRKQAEEKVRNLNAELEQHVAERTAQLEAANKELEAFSYSVSHDLRAPLRAMNGFAGMVMDEFASQLPAEAARYLGRIRHGAMKMGELIDDLLGFSRLGRQPVKREEMSMAAAVRNVLHDLAPECEGRAIEIKTGTLPDCWGDPSLLKQVWLNLLSNAIKYTRGRDPATVEIGCETGHGENVYFVRDNGAGFDMKHVHKLFGVFQRLHLADEFEGTGVGLAIVQRVVHRHGGRVWAEAEKDRGAIFRFTLEERKSI